MWYLAIALLVAIIVLALANRSSAKKIQEAEKEKEKLRLENAALATQLEKQKADMLKLSGVINELQKVKAEQETKASTRKKEPAPAGDSAARLDRLNN